MFTEIARLSRFLVVWSCTKGVRSRNVQKRSWEEHLVQHLPEVLKLVEAGLQRDPAKVSRYADLLASKLESNGDPASARLLRRAAVPTSAANLRAAKLVPKSLAPVDTESRISVADVTRPEPDSARLVLDHEPREVIEDFLDTFRSRSELLQAGLGASGHMLLYGPPGCGKSRTAQFVAGTLGLPLVTARLDGLVSSLLGSTAKNLRALFDFVDQTPCVLFLDEFDAVAKKRDDHQELGELKRVVNSLLQNIDALPEGIPVIAATNHPHLLDPAVWRRFEFHVVIGMPDRSARAQLFRMHMPPQFAADDSAIECLAALSDGLSPSDINVVCRAIGRRAVLSKTFRGSASLVHILLNFKRRQAGSRLESNQVRTVDEDIVELRRADPELFTYARIADLLSVSKGKISSVLHRFEVSHAE
ncbi:MAG: AAA family ATPase [Dehalococcoidia bacterium]